MRGCDLTPGEPNWEYRPAWHKTAWRGKDRVIIVGPKAQEILRPFLKADPQAYLFDPRDVVEAHHAERARNAEVEAHALGGRQAVQGPTGAGSRRSLRPADLPPGRHPGLQSGLPPPSTVEDQAEEADGRSAARPQGMAAEAAVVALAAPAYGRDDDPVTVWPGGVAGRPGPRKGRRDADLRGDGTWPRHMQSWPRSVELPATSEIWLNAIWRSEHTVPDHLGRGKIDCHAIRSIATQIVAPLIRRTRGVVLCTTR